MICIEMSTENRDWLKNEHNKVKILPDIYDIKMNVVNPQNMPKKSKTKI